ncbi:MAG: 16S rRNA (guanine(527)-N(7))-methyltransferase RsmG [Alphaproteobacteria bacterium]|nr:16S rRNA (guanine(527)-N(7))-methyltransferase RsmG [Alphaproteobacteria bacterium]
MLIDGPVSFSKAFSVSRETLDRLRCYASLLERWQKVHNLVSSRSLPYMWSRHFADSAQLLKPAPKARYWLDIGSGAGFPGMVVALLLSETGNCAVHLVESNAKKIAFLTAVRRETGIPVTIHDSRIEDCAVLSSLPFDVLSARALAPLQKLCVYARPFLMKGATALFQRGDEPQQHIEKIMTTENLSYKQIQSLTTPRSWILVLKAAEMNAFKPLRGPH